MAAMLASAQATLLLYEDFSYGVSDGMTMNGVATSATGLSGNYSFLNASGSSLYSTTGLSFGINYLPTSGGSVLLSATGNNAYSVITATLSASTTGTLYSSYLPNSPTSQVLPAEC